SAREGRTRKAVTAAAIRALAMIRMYRLPTVAPESDQARDIPCAAKRTGGNHASETGWIRPAMRCNRPAQSCCCRIWPTGSGELRRTEAETGFSRGTGSYEKVDIHCCARF